MILKPGVEIQGIRPELLLGLFICESVWNEHTTKEFVITSVCEGKHSPTSLHYSGCAFDIRIKHLGTTPKDSPGNGVSEAEFLAGELSYSLGKDFDVVLEKTHIHIEYQPER